MSNKELRSKGFPTNRYQRHILALTFIPSFLMCLLLAGLFSVFYHNLVDVILNQSSAKAVLLIQKWHIYLIIALLSVFFILLMWAYTVSKNLVGAFDRVIRELDKVIEDKEKRHVVVRKNDYLAKELLIRINKLIDSLPK